MLLLLQFVGLCSGFTPLLHSRGNTFMDRVPATWAGMSRLFPYSLQLLSHMPPDPAVESMRWSLLFIREYSGLPLLCICGSAVTGSLSRVLSTFGRSYVLRYLALACMRLRLLR